MSVYKEIDKLKREIKFNSLIVKYIKRDCYAKIKALSIILSNYFMMGLLTEEEAMRLIGGDN